MPEGLDAEVDLGCWTPLPVFGWLAKSAGIDEREMLRTFNCGIGMIAIVSPEKADESIAAFTNAGESVSRIGTLVPGDGEPKVRFSGALRL